MAFFVIRTLVKVVQLNILIFLWFTSLVNQCYQMGAWKLFLLVFISLVANLISVFCSECVMEMFLLSHTHTYVKLIITFGNIQSRFRFEIRSYTEWTGRLFLNWAQRKAQSRVWLHRTGEKSLCFVSLDNVFIFLSTLLDALSIE